MLGLGDCLVGGGCTFPNIISMKSTNKKVEHPGIGANKSGGWTILRCVSEEDGGFECCISTNTTTFAQHQTVIPCCSRRCSIVRGMVSLVNLVDDRNVGYDSYESRIT